MSKLLWVCETCQRAHKLERNIWKCPGCGAEVCEWCFSIFAHCQKCAAKGDEKSLIAAANNAGWDFEEATGDE